MKLCVFGKNAVFTKIPLFRGILNLIYIFLNSGPRPSHLLNEAKKICKQVIKSRACVPLKGLANGSNWATIVLVRLCMRGEEPVIVRTITSH